jgi:hypothetical protein
MAIVLNSKQMLKIHLLKIIDIRVIPIYTSAKNRISLKVNVRLLYYK